METVHSREGQRKNERKQRIDPSALFLPVLALLIIAWFAPVIFGNRIFCFGDLPRYFYPLRRFVAETVRAGGFPLWNPYLFCGYPCLAVLQSAVFYPLSVIGYLLPDFDVAFNLFIVAHFFLAGAFLFLLLRRWGLLPVSSFIGALTFTFSGYLGSVVHMNTSLSSVAWLPLILLFFDRTLFYGRPSSFLLTAVFLGVQFLGGEPTILFGTSGLLFFYCFTVVEPAAGKKENVVRLARALALLAGALLLAAALTLAQLLPFVELLGRSTRAAGGDFARLTEWSLPPFELLNFLIPFSLGDITRPAGGWGPQKWLVSGYAGIFPLLLAGVAIAFRPQRKTNLFGLLLLVSLLLALGKYTPLYRLLYRFVPGFNYIRYPVKYLFLSTFLASVLAGFGWEKLARSAEAPEPARRRLIRVLLVLNLLLGLVLLAVVAGRREILVGILRHYFPAGIADRELERVARLVITDAAALCQAMILFTLAVFLCVFRLRGKISPALAGALASLIILTDLGIAHWGKNLSAGRESFHRKTGIVRLLKEDNTDFRIFRSQPVEELNSWVYGADYGRGLEERRDTFTADTMMSYGFFDADGYESLKDGDYQRLLFAVQAHPPERSAAVLSMLNVKYLATRSPVAAPGFRTMATKPVLAGGDVWISKNENCRPRAFLVKKAKAIKDREEILAYLFSGKFDPASEAVLEEEAPGAAGKTGIAALEEVKVFVPRPGEIVVEAAPAEPAWLVLSEHAYPGWRVFVDGRAGRLLRADYVLQAVRLEPGEHQVRFFFSPWSFRVGAWGSLITVAGVVLFSGCRCRRRSRKEGAGRK